MYSSAFLFVFAAFYLQYNLSRKVRMRHKPAWLAYMEDHALFSRIAGALAAALALALLVGQLGVGSGIFGFGVVLMCAGSLVVTLAPFRYLRPAHLLALYLGCMAVELVLF